VDAVLNVALGAIYATVLVDDRRDLQVRAFGVAAVEVLDLVDFLGGFGFPGLFDQLNELLSGNPGILGSSVKLSLTLFLNEQVICQFELDLADADFLAIDGVGLEITGAADGVGHAGIGGESGFHFYFLLKISMSNCRLSLHKNYNMTNTILSIYLIKACRFAQKEYL
jgi:hypothetical protein